MSNSEEYDIIIIGAGPVGSTGANIAARHGLRCLLVDESTEVFPLPRAIHFDADIMRIFQFADVAERLEPLTRATTGGVHLGADGEPIRQFRVPDAPGDLGWRPHYMFFQPEMDAALRDAAAQRELVDARFGWRCEAVEEEGSEVRVKLRSPEGDLHEARAPFAIAADGAGSPTRKALGIKLDDYGFDEPWVVVDIRVPDADLGPDYTIMYCDPARPATYIPGPGRHRRWEFLLLPGETDEESTRPEHIRSLIADVTPWIDIDTIEVSRSAVYRFHALVAEEWRNGRVFLAGDAAHQTPPFYGQGMCHGLRDMRNLLWKIDAIREERLDISVLDTYQEEREPHVRAVIEAAVANGQYISTLDPQRAAERDAELRSRVEEGKDVRSFRDVIPGLKQGILDTEDEPGARGLLFVQPPVRASNGKETLLDELIGEDWALVTSVSPRLFHEADERLYRLGVRVISIGDATEALDGTFKAWFEAFDCVAALIRPDRYVFGTAQTAQDIPSLLERLDDRLPTAGEAESKARA